MSSTSLGHIPIACKVHVASSGHELDVKYFPGHAQFQIFSPLIPLGTAQLIDHRIFIGKIDQNYCGPADLPCLQGMWHKVLPDPLICEPRLSDIGSWGSPNPFSLSHTLSVNTCIQQNISILTNNVFFPPTRWHFPTTKHSSVITSSDATPTMVSKGRKALLGGGC